MNTVYDSVGFYYVSVTFIAMAVLPATVYILWTEIMSSKTSTIKREKTDIETTNSGGEVLDDLTNVKVDTTKFIEEKLKKKNILTTQSFKEKYFKKRYLLLLLGWILLIWLLTMAHTMESKGFATFEPYAILGIDLDATEVQIKRAYRKLAMQWHPDKHPMNKAEAENKFTMIAKAYAALTDPRVKANMERYGNPDGFRSGQSMTMALPEFLSNADYSIYILIAYFFIFIVIPPALGYMWWKKSSQFHETGILNQTVGWYAGSINPNLAFPYLIEPFSIAAEFRVFNEQPQTPERIEAITNILKQVKIVKHKFEKVYYIMLTSTLLHGYMQRIDMDPMFKDDLKYILEKSYPLLYALLEISRASRMFTPAMAAIDFMQNICQGMWTRDSPLLQLPNLTADDITKLRKKGIESIPDFRGYSRAGVIKILGCSDAQYEEMASVAKIIPILQVDVKAGVPDCDDIRIDDVIEVNVTLIRREDIFINDEHVVGGRKPSKKKTSQSVVTKVLRSSEEKEKIKNELVEKIESWDAVTMPKVKSATGDAPLVLSNTFPFSRKEGWYVLLVYIDTANKREVIIDMRTLKSFDDVEEVKFLMKAPETAGTYNYEVHVRCDSYVGCDVVKKITTYIEVPSKAPRSSVKIEEDNGENAVVEDEDEENVSDSDDDEDANPNLDQEMEELFADDDEDVEYEELPGKWYYLGATGFLDFVVNIVIIAGLAYFAYNYLHNRGIWQKYLEPHLNKVTVKITPIIQSAWTTVEPFAQPVIDVLNSALDRFLGEGEDIPMEIKLDKLNRLRGRGGLF